MVFFLLTFAVDVLCSQVVSPKNHLTFISALKREISRLSECFSNTQLNDFEKIIDDFICPNLVIRLQQIYLQHFFQAANISRVNKALSLKINAFQKLCVRVEADLQRIKFKTAVTSLIVLLLAAILDYVMSDHSQSSMSLAPFLLIPFALVFKIATLFFYQRALLDFSFFRLFLDSACRTYTTESHIYSLPCTLVTTLAEKTLLQTRMRQLLPISELLYFLLQGSAFGVIFVEKYSGSF